MAKPIIVTKDDESKKNISKFVNIIVIINI